MINNFDPVNSPLVHQQLQKDNYLIEDSDADNNICCIYFSSHGVYFPETENNFTDKIVNKNVFEWYRRKLPGIKRHIFIRDIRKQFYVEGINHEINTIDKLISFLKDATNGFEVITVGSSAGGYISAIVGGVIGSKRCYVFSAQFSLKDDFAYPTKELLIKHENDEQYYKWYDIASLSKSNMIYVYPVYSECDIAQSCLLQKALSFHDRDSIVIFPMKESIHGVPLYKSCINELLAMEFEEIRNLRRCFEENQPISPFLLSLKIVGLPKTMKGFLIKNIIHLRNKLRK